MIPLTKPQLEIMTEFYSKKPIKVVFNKATRNELWKIATKRQDIPLSFKLNVACPALEHQIIRSYRSEKNIQSAVFSECVYAQTLANMLGLSCFNICVDVPSFLPNHITQLLKSYLLTPRYVYSNTDKSRMLVQAGGCNGIDSALITVIDLNVYTIEFKETGAKTSEPDLPRYKEDGKLITTADFQRRYPQFTDMLSQHIGTSMFDIMGNNIHKFTSESIYVAVTNNYVKKFADVCCTEDKNDYLVMLPLNQVSQWAVIKGEIRPAGRNHYSVWTPIALKEFIKDKGGIVKNDFVTIDKNKLSERRARGGNKKITGYKINQLFFVYTDNCQVENNDLVFSLNSVRQLNPTIAGKVFFDDLQYLAIKKYYNL